MKLTIVSILTVIAVWFALGSPGMASARELTVEEILCNCQNFITWRGHNIPSPLHQNTIKPGKPRVGSVAIWYWPQLGYGHVAEVILVSDTKFWTIGSNERGCGLFVTVTDLTDQAYQGWLE